MSRREFANLKELQDFARWPAEGQRRRNGMILKDEACMMPPLTYAQDMEWGKRFYEWNAMRAHAGFESRQIRYLSDGLEINGFIYKPVDTAGRSLPIVIMNRGGSRRSPAELARPESLTGLADRRRLVFSSPMTSLAAWRTRGLAIPPAVVPGCTRCYSAMGASKRCHMSTRKRWRRPPPAPPRIEDRYWRRAPGGLVGWSGRVLQPDQLIRQHEPEKDAPITATPHARASIGGR
jgi:hypothetical protein